MAFKPIDWMFGAGTMKKNRDAAIRMANELYNPNQLNPMIDAARDQAYEGIDDANIRAAVLSRMYASEPQNAAAAFGGNATAFMAGTQASDAQRSQALGMAELDIATREEEAKRLGRMSMAEILTQQNQLAAQRKASITGAKMQYDAQIQQGRLSTVAALGQLAVTAAAMSGGAPPVAGAGVAAVPGVTTDVGTLTVPPIGGFNKNTVPSFNPLETSPTPSVAPPVYAPPMKAKAPVGIPGNLPPFVKTPANSPNWWEEPMVRKMNKPEPKRGVDDPSKSWIEYLSSSFSNW